MDNLRRATSVSFAVALTIIVILGVAEYFAATRFESQYVSAKEYSVLSRLLLIGKRERGTLIHFEGHGYHAIVPNVTRDEVAERLKHRFPNEFDPKKMTWVLTDDDGAFFYKLAPNWAGSAFLLTVAFLVSIFPVHLILRRPPPILLDGRLADVLALIQVLSLDRSAHRSESGLCTEFQGKPASSQTWTDVAKAHPEFFRVKATGENVVSLVARHVTEPAGETRSPLPAEYVGNLLNLAVEVHDRELQRMKGWHVWVPIIVALVAGVFTIVGAVVGR